MFATQDAHGPIRHGIVQISLHLAGGAAATRPVNPQLGTLVELLNTPPVDQVCPQTSARQRQPAPRAATTRASADRGPRR